MKLPEITLYKVISNLVETLRDDIKANPNTSFIERFYGSEAVGEYAFAKQTKQILSVNKEHQNELKVNLFFNAQRAAIPTIHITLPFEKVSGDNGLGTDEGYVESRETLEGTFTNYTRNFNTSYSIVVTSSNSLEVLAIYHMLKAILIASTPAMEAIGFKNLKLSGGDLHLNADIIPKGVFVRALSLDFSYDLTVETVNLQQFVKEFIIKGTAVVG
jgi:hypothetical protein